jgi:hypothetical protein
VPDPLVLQIADALIAKAVAVGFRSTGLLTDVGKLWAEEQNHPAAYLGDAGERNEYRPTARISPTAGFFFYTILKGPTPTRDFLKTYMPALKNAIDNDPTLGGLCEKAQLTGYQSLNTTANISQKTHVADVFVEVEYKHVRGAA